MFPQGVVNFFAGQQELLWITTLFLDLSCTVLLYRFFGKAGLQVTIATAIILANLQGPKLTIIFGFQTSLGVIFYSSIFFASLLRAKLLIVVVDCNDECRWQQ